jgi:hypothetical protein
MQHAAPKGQKTRFCTNAVLAAKAIESERKHFFTVQNSNFSFIFTLWQWDFDCALPNFVICKSDTVVSTSRTIYFYISHLGRHRRHRDVQAHICSGICRLIQLLLTFISFCFKIDLAHLHLHLHLHAHAQPLPSLFSHQPLDGSMNQALPHLKYFSIKHCAATAAAAAHRKCFLHTLFAPLSSPLPFPFPQPFSPYDCLTRARPDHPDRKEKERKKVFYLARAQLSSFFRSGLRHQNRKEYGTHVEKMCMISLYGIL